jgi:predicted MPP superfamily phosphohydrolase
LSLTDLAFFCIGKTLFTSQRRRGRRLERSEARWRFLVALVAAIGLSFAGLLGVAQFTVERLNIPIRGLDRALNGTTVVQLSDIHLGGYSGRSTLQRIVDETNKLNPDLVVITGDLVDGAVVFLREIVHPLHGLRGKHGVFFATGM